MIFPETPLFSSSSSGRVDLTDAFIKKASAAGVNRGWSAELQNPGVGVLGQDVRFVDYATLTNIAVVGNVGLLR